MLHFFDPVVPILMGPSGLHPATGFYDSHQATFFLAGNPRVAVVEQRPHVLAVLDSTDLRLIHWHFSRPANALIVESEGKDPSIHITLSQPTGWVPQNKLWLCSDFNGDDWRRVYGNNKAPAYNYGVFLATGNVLVCTYKLGIPDILLETIKLLRFK